MSQLRFSKVSTSGLGSRRRGNCLNVPVSYSAVVFFMSKIVLGALVVCGFDRLFLSSEVLLDLKTFLLAFLLMLYEDSILLFDCECNLELNISISEDYSSRLR